MPDLAGVVASSDLVAEVAPVTLVEKLNSLQHNRFVVARFHWGRVVEGQARVYDRLIKVFPSNGDPVVLRWSDGTIAQDLHSIDIEVTS